MNPLQPPENGVNIMKCNPDDYREDLAYFDMTTEQEDELLFTLWEMMRTFAEMGQGVQSINNIFPQIFEKADQDTVNLSD
ncbi:MAG: hypothetical protein ABJH28_12515 [Paraglaciecola sp.]|uniref:hypothetical protein n=1 Tax=Paraglaciecola sp. TaxID=1920173 RepID=UPI0032631260